MIMNWHIVINKNINYLDINNNILFFYILYLVRRIVFVLFLHYTVTVMAQLADYSSDPDEDKQIINVDTPGWGQYI